MQNLSDLQGKVPSLQIYAARGSNTTLTAYIRGVGQADPTWGFDPAVGIYLDDVYMARPQGTVLDVFDTNRIEVLRGPQGSLYGKNTIGGAIKYVSNPLPTQTTGSVEGTVGTHNKFKTAMMYKTIKLHRTKPAERDVDKKTPGPVGVAFPLLFVLPRRVVDIQLHELHLFIIKQRNGNAAPFTARAFSCLINLAAPLLFNFLD